MTQAALTISEFTESATVKGQPATLAPRYIRGLDSLRFVCALWVAFGHCGFLPINFTEHSRWSLVFRGLYNNLFPGPAAVIVFFVISGFCIHFPYRSLQISPPLFRYFFRRSLRVGIPVAGTLIIHKLINSETGFLWTGILWSIICEEIYYALYPTFLNVRRRFNSFLPMVLLSYAISFAIILTHSREPSYNGFTDWFNWLVGLPCWFLGCYLAESVESLKKIFRSGLALWAWRLSILALAICCSTLRFHSPVGYPWSLNVFVIAVFFWLRGEVAAYNFQNVKPSRVLEGAGKWSYSLYLMHVPVFMAIQNILPSTEPHLLWMIKISIVLSSTYLFYLLVEKPSHRLAKKISIDVS